MTGSDADRLDPHRNDASGGSLPIRLAAAIRDTAGEIAALLGECEDTGLPVPRSTWNVGEAAAHLGQANELMADIAAGRERPYGDGTPGSLASANARALAAFGERRAEPLAELIAHQAEVFLDAAAPRSPDETVNTPMGPMALAVLGSYLLTHMLGHGYDLARALGRPHMLDRARVELTLPFLLVAMPRVADVDAVAGLDARYTVRLWGGAEFGVAFADGAVLTSPVPHGGAQCTILIEPVSFLLLALGRGDRWATMGRGRVLAWGRKAWLGPRFPTLFTAP